MNLGELIKFYFPWNHQKMVGFLMTFERIKLRNCLNSLMLEAKFGIKTYVAVMVFFSFDPTTETLLLHFGVRILLQFGLHCKKRNFPLRISSVNVTKSAGNYGFSHIYWRNSPWKISFFAVLDSLSLMWVFGLFQFSKRSDGDSPFQFFTYFFWDAKIPRCNLQA